MDPLLARLGFDFIVDPTRLILIGALTAARIIPIFTLAPFLGGKLVPGTIKIAISLTFVVMVFPMVASRTPDLNAMSPALLVALFLKEIAVGVVIGFLSSLPFFAAEAAGRLADTGRGANMSEVLVPQLGTRSSPLGDLSLQLAIVIFWAMDGHLLFFNALASSYEALPITGFPSVAAAQGVGNLAVYATSHLILVTLGLAAPVLAATFLTDLSLGLVNRVSPQIQVFFVGMPAKALIGVMVMMLAFAGIALALRGELANAILYVRHAFEIVR